MYYRYSDRSTADTPHNWVYRGSCANVTTYKDTSWVEKVCNHGKSRGLIRGVPSLATEMSPLGCYDYFNGEIPTPKDITIVDQRQVTRKPYKEFRKRFENKEVILNPMYAETFTARLHPGVPEGTPVQRQHELGFYTDDLSQPGSLCPGWASAIYALGGIDLTYPAMWRITNVRPQQLVRRRFDVYDTKTLTLPPEEVVREAARQIRVFFADEPHDGQLVSEALCKANLGAYDVLTDLAESRNTIEFCLDALSNIIKLIRKLMRELRRARQMHTSLAAINRTCAEIWLQFRYAVMPIMYSIEDAIKYMESQYHPYQTIREGKNLELTLDLPSGWVADAPIEFRDRCYVKTMFDVDNFNHNLTVSAPRTAWEKVRLSWVIDWVYNVGEFLTAIDTPSSVKYRGTQYSRQIKTNRIKIRHSSGLRGTFDLHAKAYKVDIIDDPLAWISLPLDVQMNWRRWLDAVSLAWMRQKEQLKYLRG